MVVDWSRWNWTPLPVADGKISMFGEGPEGDWPPITKVIKTFGCDTGLAVVVVVVVVDVVVVVVVVEVPSVRVNVTASSKAILSRSSKSSSISSSAKSKAGFSNS